MNYCKVVFLFKNAWLIFQFVYTFSWAITCTLIQANTLKRGFMHTHICTHIEAHTLSTLRRQNFWFDVHTGVSMKNFFDLMYTQGCPHFFFWFDEHTGVSTHTHTCSHVRAHNTHTHTHTHFFSHFLIQNRATDTYIKDENGKKWFEGYSHVIF